ncbi:uncharacterized protein LOC120484966 [Pimephales promelas]|uniref:uncharacterized protein LOC120484966 n=1 Tax=Pimephales promelas TaxID=90988 RepID=UPI001955CE85|nr:uncharacterized protein LOC120484966 [Pimephales promelas]
MQGLPLVQGSTAATYKAEKKMDKFKMEKESWVCKTKKNQLTSHLLDDAVILIEKLNAVGWRPMLFLEYPNQIVKTLLPEGLKLSAGEKICVDNMNTIYSMIVKGNTVPADPSTESLQLDPEQETVVVLNLETIPDPPPQQVEALLPTSPATDTNEGGQIETVEALLPTSPATDTNEGGQIETVEALLPTSPATDTNEGGQIETVEALLPTSPATDTNEGGQIETVEALPTSPATDTNRGGGMTNQRKDVKGQKFLKKKWIVPTTSKRCTHINA